MTRSLKVYQGEDETPVRNLTEPSSNVHAIWEEIEAGHRAYQVEATQSSFPMRDERGESGSELNLPSGLTHISLSAHNLMEWLEGSTVMFRGRIGPKDYSRGRQKADRAREVTVNAQDINFDLRGIIVDGWVRDAETDVARVQALVADYLQGDPRATTNISTTYVATGSNTVNLPAQRYDSTSPDTILRDIATLANKLAFVTIDRELFYDGHDSTAYQAGLRISDRIDEIDTSGACSPSGVAGYLGAATSNIGDNFASDYPPWAGDNEERVELLISSGVSAGDTIIVLAAWNQTFTPTETVYDQRGNTWTLDAEHEFTASSLDDTIQIWRCNVTNALSAGDYIRLAFNFGASLLSAVESSALVIGAWTYPGTLSSPSVGTGAGATNSTMTITAPAGDVVIAAGSFQAHADVTVTPDVDWDAMVPKTYIAGSGDLDKNLFAQQLANQAGTNAWTVALSPANDWAAIAVGYTQETGSGDDLPTFPPIWDVGPSSTEDGLQLLSGLRLYYGQGSNTYVYVNDPVTANQYSHFEEALFTSDPAITTAAQATTLANSILQRRKREERTYNASIGPLNENQIGCLKAGQLINIKARAIPDADDAFVTRRIAQLKWTTPVPGLFFAHMQLDRPIKEVPHDVGPRQAFEVSDKHILQGSNSHPDLVPKAVLSSQGDIPYRGASDWTRLAIGGSNTHLISDGIVPKWVANTSGGGSGVTDHGALTGLTDDDHPQYALESPPVVAHGTMGGSEDFDFTDGTDHEGTLDQNLTVTLSGATNGEAAWMTLKLTQDGTGTNTIDLPASVVNAADVEGAFDTAANAVNIISVFTYDGGSTWYAFLAGGGITAADVKDVGRWEPVVVDEGSGPEIVFADGDIVMHWIDT